MMFHEAITEYNKVHLNRWEGKDYVYIQHYNDGTPYISYHCDNYLWDEIAGEILENYFTDAWEEYIEK